MIKNKFVSELELKHFETQFYKKVKVGTEQV